MLTETVFIEQIIVYTATISVHEYTSNDIIHVTKGGSKMGESGEEVGSEKVKETKRFSVNSSTDTLTLFNSFTVSDLYISHSIHKLLRVWYSISPTPHRSHRIL